jgi:selenocysteine lyase/cysteine desulfurase
MTDSRSQLECGSSLAEREFASEHQQEERQQQENYLNNFQLPALGTFEEIINSIRDEIANDIVSNGNVQMFTSPFETAATHASVGQTNIPEDERYVKVPLVYCDQTASNRSLVSVEKYIYDKCLPLYGNTHTNTSITGSQSTAFVAEARQIVAEGCNAKITGKASQDVVLFAGNGATSTVELLIDCLGIKALANSETKPVVFIGPYEHHSNLVPWRESGCEIVMIPEDPIHGNVDIQELEKKLKLPEYGGERLRMGAFSAASNVTGLVSDVNAIAATLHRHNALCFFDYATGAPYLPIDMNPPACGQYYTGEIAKDAIFISPHKMIGGVSTPGILVVKKHLVNQTIAPNRSGGGTVFYVTHKHHRFLSNRIERFEGGTPDVIGILRAGLTFLVKRKISNKYQLAVSKHAGAIELKVPTSIETFEYYTFQNTVARLKKSAPNLIILGTGSEVDMKIDHLPIFSFLIKCGDRFLHYNYVCAILNDLFGIQSRGGCMCSGPYSQRLLGLTTYKNGEDVPNEVNERIEYALLHFKERSELLRPGFTRLSLPFKGCRTVEVEYVIKALEWVSKNAWVFMCQYRCNHRTGEWRHFSRQGKPLGRSQRRWLSRFELNYCPKEEQISLFSNVDEALTEAFKNAEYQLKLARSNPLYTSQALKMTDENQVLDIDDELDKLRWYVYPRECAVQVKRGADVFPDTYSKKLQGGIRPLGFFPAADIHFDSLLPSVNLVEKKGEAKSIDKDEDVTVSPSDEITLFHFQDGENHAGEAHVDDIITGYYEQELSENCLVYVPHLDEWKSIREFVVHRMKSKESHGQVHDQNTSTSHRIPQQDISQEHKKPSRDRSEWGKVSSVAIPKVEASVDANSIHCKSMDVNENQNQDNSVKKRKKQNHARPPAKLMKYITQAVIQWDMIKDGDKLLLGLSGGKDSLSLLHCLLELKRKLPQSFEIEVCTIDPMTPSFDPSPLIPYVQSLGLKYHYIRDNIVDRANSCGKNGEVVKSLCAFCARMKRGNLYTCARENNCNKLVLAQHLDDCAESCFMSIFHNGIIRSK